MNDPFIPSEKTLIMKQSTPSHPRQSSLFNTTWSRFSKFGVLSVAFASAAIPMAHSTGLVVDTITATIAATGQFNIKDNAVIVHISVGGLLGPILAPNTGYLSTGLNLLGLAPGGANAWLDGYGINSSTGAVDGNSGNGSFVHGIGGVVNELHASLGGGPLFGATFFGRPVVTTDILIRYTCMGDANLDGTIDGVDQFLLDNGVINNLGGWLNGDFDYNGALDGVDQFLLDGAAIAGCTVLPTPPAPPLAFGAAVPEPSSTLLLVLGLTGLLNTIRSNRKQA